MGPDIEQCSSGSGSTFIVMPSPRDVSEDPGIPELQRTDGVVMRRSYEFTEDEYVPGTTDDLEADVPEVQQQKRRKRVLKKASVRSQEVNEQKHKRSQMTPPRAGENSKGCSSSESSDVSVMMLKKKKDGGRLYNKKYYCVYCVKPFSKMARHLESKHKDHAEVARAFEFPKGSKERKIQLNLLRNRGNRARIAEVLKEMMGLLIPRQQSTVPVSPSEYLHCVNCKALLKRKSLWMHMKRCQLSVMMLKKKKDGGRLYNKKYYCVYCVKPFSKMARHLESKHKDHAEVARALEFPKGSKERRIQLNLLRNRGNRAHNAEVLKKGKGLLIPRQQSTVPVSPSEYLHCVYCEALLKRKSLWVHMKRCQLSKEAACLKPGRTRVQAVCAYAQPVPDGVKAAVWKLVNNMNEDEVSRVIRKERCILTFGEHLYNKNGHDITKHEYIRQKMREVGRLILQGKLGGILNRAHDFFVPANFPHVIEAVKSVAGFDEKKGIYKTPSLALKLGHNLKKLANIVECEAMITGDKDTARDVQLFKQICDTKWNECVSAQALRNLNEAKWNAPKLLPFAEDVKKMHLHLDKQRKQYQAKLEEQPTKKNWAELAKLTLCEVILFNRRREGEVSRMPLRAFEMRDTSPIHPDVEMALSDLEKKLCKHFQLIEIRGKRGRKVPVLLTSDMLASMELLVKTRQKCDVPHDNDFMFARPEAQTYIRGSDAVRHCAQSCGAKHPEMLSSTKLRKHMATMCKVLNLKDNEMDDLADLLGHDIRVHRQNYRLPESTLQLAKISKLLMAMERGMLSEYEGRNLDQINIDPNEKISVDTDVSDSDDEDGVRLIEAVTSSSESSGTCRLIKQCREGQNGNDPPGAKDVSETAVVGGRCGEGEAAEGWTWCRRDFTLGGMDQWVEWPSCDWKVAGSIFGPSSSCRSVPEQDIEPRIAPGSSKPKRRMWTREEVDAVEKTLMDCIRSGRVPGQAQCMKCIETSPQALRGRTWTAVKFYVKNRIDASKRSMKPK
ncbi:leukocyte receptor cluster member 8 homolog isoform X2 [Acanthochromis polyacanthus]|nr:leukocyte receptor cluster member 8 homolog isoform X3 [Acanthochromis polyacanthus]XP_022055393.2 leukocyte receptor cluster member 8 homolog isoform X2 [Acanthochromis polyacanthus]